MPFPTDRSSQQNSKQKQSPSIALATLILLTVLIHPMVPHDLGAEELPRYNEAVQLFQQGKYEDSLEAIRSVFDDYKTSYDFRMLAAANYLEQSNFEAAVSHLRYCMKDHPGRAEPHALLAAVYRRSGQPVKALAHIRDVIGKFPDSDDIRWEAALSYLALDRVEAARTHVSKILSGNPSHFGALYLDGVLYLKAGDLENAEFRLRNAARVGTPDQNLQFGLLNNLGLTLSLLATRATGERREDYLKRAREYLQKAAEIRPNDPALKRNMANLPAS
ncbi:MAG: tetratricopeptide repeat protein [Leptospiraceae bacterium]|nr:tetratricopeptide repeat protein [Leptospiraceae bacterium]